MAEDFHHCMWLCEKLLPDLEWERIREDWTGFAGLDHGDNEPFHIMRMALAKAVKEREE